ncbi:DgyrCDS8870 [Dimorphilus gyrociliatus]|uniref:arginine--tRNA ligase n=1 Tax=Dimorphilus gyrociliatus TaxID=2664684 RepID=A0A7I8W0K7_9ANNE|nr:DgyrCDS8870 [Dimorphilus gyrociliatus]
MDTEVQKVLERTKAAEQEINHLESELKAMQQNSSNDENDPAIEALRTENSKLKYQRMHLQRAINEQSKNSGKNMTSLIKILKNFFQESLNSSYPQLSHCTVDVTPSTKITFGDYQCNSAMALSGEMKKLGAKTAPREIAQNLVAKLPLSSSEVIEKTEIAGPGFINIHLKNSFVLSELTALITKGVRPPYVGPTKRVIVDMSSPNIAKEMHVGHLRSTIIGDSISRLCSYVGHDVLKLNHLGDWGTQFGMLITHLIEKFPNYKTEMPPISDLMEFYRESKKRFDSDEEFKKTAYQNVVRLQAKEEDYYKAWLLICHESFKAFNKIYKYLDVQNLVNRGESFYQDLMKDTVEMLDRNGVTEIDEGRKIAWPTGEKGQGVPLTLVKSDGGFTYDTSDMAALRHRLFEEKADWILYCVDQGQSTHFDAIYQTAQTAGWYDPKEKRVEHVGFGLVLGDDKKKFKTRSGDTVRLQELLDEGLMRSEKKLKENNRDSVLTPEEFKAAKEATAFGCIKYADLSHVRTHDYVFSFDRMLDDKGNTAIYLLYAYTRIRSIVKNTNLSKEEIEKLAANATAESLPIDHPREIRLAKFLLKWPEVIETVYKTLMVNSLCEFLYELAGVFTEFYEKCYVVEKDRTTGEIVKVNTHRLLLCEATANVMRAGFDILGLQAIDKM